MSNTTPGVVHDYNAPDIHDKDTASVQDAINESHKQREAAKAANRAKVQKAKRRGWRIALFHWITYYCGLGCTIYVAFLLGLPGWVAVAAAVLFTAECVFCMNHLARAYPKK